MSVSRERVLTRIRQALGRDATDTGDPEVVRARIERHVRQIEPAFDEPLAERFLDKLQTAGATVAGVATPAEAGSEIERYCDEIGISKKLLISGDELLQRIDWPASIERQQRPAGGADRAAVTSALCGISETGTLMLVSGAHNPTSLNFLPDYHIVVLNAAQLLPRMEDAWDHLRASFAQIPRTVNFISGPSKTADIEQTVEYGAHGPRGLHVILVG